MEVATARWFGAPELRNGHLEHPTPAADIYSLVKILYKQSPETRALHQNS